jgi:predicted AAA+ superfamily ATPase
VLLGSAPLLVQQGLTESLAGRFELIRVSHWSYPEMREAFGWDLDRYLLFGGYPGAAPLADEPGRWAAYVRDALVETTLSRDVLLMSRVDKPALLRQLFDLACAYSGQELSYTKMLGQLQDAGNTTTLAHYLSLLAGAGLVVGLQKYAGDAARRRASSPKLTVLNTALSTSRAGVVHDRLRDDPIAWGRLVESCVGAHLLNTAAEAGLNVSWWREGDAEVDFVLHAGASIVGIEVKSAFSAPPRGLTAFRGHFPRVHTLVVGAGSGAIPLETFLSRPAAEWLP